MLYDRPGSGLSRNAEPPTNLDDDVAIFDGLIETLGATQLSLLGRAAAGQWRSGGRACIQTESLGCSFKSSTVRKIAPSLTAQGSGWPDRSRAPNSPRCRAAIIHSGSSQKSQTCSRLGLRQCEAPRRQVARCAASIHLERALYIDGAAIGLTAKQYALLKYLVDRQGNIVSRESLVQKVWHQETTGSNVVDAVVRSLRKKLGPWAPSIETAIGHGYRFIGWRRLG